MDFDGRSMIDGDLYLFINVDHHVPWEVIAWSPHCPPPPHGCRCRKAETSPAATYGNGDGNGGPWVDGGTLCAENIHQEISRNLREDPDIPDIS